MWNVQEVVATHEAMLRTFLHSATPATDAIHQETDWQMQRSEFVAGVASPAQDAGAKHSAVAALQMKVAIALLAESLMESEFQQAACSRLVPACLGCTFLHLSLAPLPSPQLIVLPSLQLLIEDKFT
jgi:hypothetical protein